MTKTTLLAIAMMICSVAHGASIDDFIATKDSGNVAVQISESELVKMLAEGRTCVKDGVAVLAHSKDVTKKHCQKSTILKLRTVKANQLSPETYTKLTGLK